MWVGQCRCCLLLSWDGLRHLFKDSKSQGLVLDTTYLYEKWCSVVLGLWSDVFENRWSPEEEAWGLKFPRTTDGAARGIRFHGKCTAIPPQNVKVPIVQVLCACHYAFAGGVHAPCDGLLTLRQNNSYYRLFPHSSFTQLESLMTAASSYPTETFCKLQAMLNYSNFKSAMSTLSKPPPWKRQVWCDCPAFYFGSFYLDHLGSTPHGCITEGGALSAIFGKLCYQLPTTTTTTIGTITTIALAQ